MMTAGESSLAANCLKLHKVKQIVYTTSIIRLRKYLVPFDRRICERNVYGLQSSSGVSFQKRQSYNSVTLFFIIKLLKISLSQH